MESLDYRNIEVLAHYLYITQGRQEGRALDHWIEAEKQLSENLFWNKPHLKQTSRNHMLYL